MKEDMHSDVQYWLDEISESRKREKAYRAKGKEIIDIYSGEDTDKVPFNVLYSNTEIMLPALFSATPRTVVRPRFKNKGKAKLSHSAAKAAERMAEYLIDTNFDGYDSFYNVISDACLNALLPGRGDVCVKYEVEGDFYKDEEGENFDQRFEHAYISSYKWDRVYYGYSVNWTDVPWKAYELFLDKDQCKELFGTTKANKMTFTEGEESDNDENDFVSQDEKYTGKKKTALIYQIWDKDNKQVLYVSPHFKKGILKKVKDPLELSGFFDSPRPLQFIRKTHEILPVAPYVLYENQAKELNRITRRLKKVVEAIKVRGVYNAQFGDSFERILDEDDNALIPTDEGASILDGALDKAIWVMPIGELTVVAQQLMEARESVKRVIYEITGISDILRGSSKASETLGAQKIKEAWGSMRIKRPQKDVQDFVRSCIRMLIEVACNKFSDESWIKMTGLPYLTEEQFNQAQMDLQQATIIIQQAQREGQQPPEDLMKKAETAKLALEQPRWVEVLQVLRDDFTRSYLIDIETNSTLDAEASEDKKHVAEFMNALAQFMNGVAPLVQQRTLPFDAMKSMLLAVTQRYRFGNEVEEEIKKMREPEGPSEEQVKQKEKELAKKQQELQQMEQKVKQQADQYGEQLDNEFRKLEEAQQEFEFQKKLFAEEQEFNKRLADMELQADQKDAENQIKEMIANHKREVQSMMDKQANNLKMMLTEAVSGKESEGK